MSNKVTKVAQFIADGWSNVLTGLGIAGKDKRMSSEVTWSRMSREDADNLYAGDDISSNIVDIVPEESLSKGYTLTGLDKEITEDLVNEANNLQLNRKVLETWKMGRQYGGALLIKVCEDASIEAPMSGRMIKNLIPISRWELSPDVNNLTTDIFSINFGKPESYRLFSEQVQNTRGMIHHTRAIRFDGQKLPLQLYKNNNHWHDSVLNKLQNAIRNYNISHDAGAATLQDFSVPVMKLNGLADSLRADENCGKDIQNRMMMVNLTKAIARMIVIDADNESFEHATRNVTGFADLLGKVESRLSTAAKMPRTKLFGESAGGLGSTGEHQENNWNDFIISEQTNYLKPLLLELYKDILRAKYPNIDGKKLDIEFVPLKQLSEKSEAEIRKIQAEVDNIYIQAGVIDTTEVAQSRFGGDKYSTDTKIDVSLRLEPPVNTADPLVNPNDPNNPQPAANQPAVDPSADATTKAVALNGAQVTSLQDLIVNVQTGVLEKETGIKLAMIGFGLERPKAENLFADVVPKSQDPIPPQNGFSFKKGNSFDEEITIRAANGDALDLDGYEFKGYFKSHANVNENLASFDVVKTDKKGVIRLSVNKDTVDKMLSVRMDSDESLNCHLFVKMIKPNGQSKIIKSAKAVFNV